MRTASEQYFRIQHDVDALRRGNAVLERDVERLRRDPRAIELAARSLNMARANEIIVPVEWALGDACSHGCLGFHVLFRPLPALSSPAW